MCGTFRRIPNAFDFHDLASPVPAPRSGAPSCQQSANKKVGSRPLGHATGFNPTKYNEARLQKQARQMWTRPACCAPGREPRAELARTEPLENHGARLGLLFL